MKYPKFYDNVSEIKLYDPLSDFLGSVKNGIVTITYLDVVKFSGHSCPTVAGAYLMTMLGLKALIKEGELITRSDIVITAKGPKSEGTNGVVANVAAYICGVNDESGFSGIAGRMSRKNKLFYENSLNCDLKFEYKSKKVELSYNPSIFPPNPNMIPLLQKQINEIATEEEKIMFQKLWLERVKKILLTENKYNEIIIVNLID